MELQTSHIFMMDKLDKNEKYFLTYLHCKEAHIKPFKLGVKDIEKEVGMERTGLWRVTKSLEQIGVVKTHREYSNAIKQYEIDKKIWFELTGELACEVG